MRASTAGRGGGAGSTVGGAVALAAALAFGCAGAATTRGPRPRDAVIKIRSSDVDAALWFDDRFLGPLELFPGGIAVAPGVHRLELRHEDHFTHYEELRLAPGEQITLAIELVPVPP